MRGAILAGGRATRFGGKPKGLERVGGERILDRLVGAMTAVVGTAPVLITSTPDAPHWPHGLDVVPDRRPGHGALGGMHTAVTGGHDQVLLVAWDMPFVPQSLLAALVHGSVGYDVYLPASQGPRGVEPLCGVYGPACAAPIEAALDARDLRAIAFHHAVTVGTMPLDAVQAHGDPARMFFNVNSADDLARAEAQWRSRAS